MISTLVPAFLMGIFGGVHCAAMCGGAASVLCAGAGPASSRPVAVGYNAGRVAGYVALGAGAGALSAASFALSFDGVRFALRAAAAICMLAVGLHLFGLPSFVGKIEAIGGPIWARVAPLARRLVPLRTVSAALAAGLLWALMPCGLVYGALALAASAGSAFEGAATMGAFGAGTLPVMLGLTTIARPLAQRAQRGWLRRVAGVVVLAFGVWNGAALAQQGNPARAPHACCPHR